MNQLNFLIAAFSLLACVSAQCYSYAGVERDSTYVPCNGSAPVSMCCHTGAIYNNGDVCGTGSAYGLCGVTGTQLSRESCTDSTWESPSCLKLCLGVNDTMITQCQDGSYCCGRNAQDCCNAGEGKFIVNNQVADSPASSSSTSSSSTSSTSIGSSSITSIMSASFTSTSTSIPAPALTSTDTKASSNSPKGIATGLIIGLVVLGLVVCAVAIFLWKWIAKRKKLKAQGDVIAKSSVEDTESYEHRSEVDSVSKPAEMDCIPRPAEVEQRQVAEIM